MKCKTCGKEVDKLYNGECIECANNMNDEKVVEDIKVQKIQRWDTLPLTDEDIRINRYAGITSNFMIKRNNLLGLEQHVKDFICKGCDKCKDLRQKVAFNRYEIMTNKNLKCEDIKAMKGI